LPGLAQGGIPVYYGCDWDNVPMHLPGTFSGWKALQHNPNVRMAMLPAGGTTWPWEAMHVEALAWFDQYLKGRQTGITEGPRIRYWLPVAEEWRTADTWPPRADYLELGLGADATLAEQPQDGNRDYLSLGTGLNRPPRAAKSDPPSVLQWQTVPLERDLDVAGDIELRLTASSTANDTAWIVMLRDVAPDGTVTDITGGWLRASLREVDSVASSTGAPELSCRNPQLVPINERVDYRIPLAPNARRFQAGHRIQLMITSDDQSKDVPVFLGYRHPPVGTNTRNTVFSTSRLVLPVLQSPADTDA